MNSKKLKAMGLKARFLANIEKEDAGCWIWTGSKTPSGYGRIFVKGVTWRAHRLAYKLFNGPLHDELCVCHKCDNPLCVNPGHLWLGTHAENIQDRHVKGRTAVGRAISNTNKLSEKEVLAMRSLWEKKGARLKPGARGGFNYSELGRRFGVSSTMARNIILRKSWKHLP